MYELFVNEGYGSTVFTKVDSYDGLSSTHQLTIGSDSIEAGKVYKFKYRSYNSYGYSDFSEELNSAVGGFPSKPNQLRKNEDLSGETFITLEWDQVPDTQLQVISYSIKVNDGYGGD